METFSQLPTKSDLKSRVAAAGRWTLKHSRALSVPFVVGVYVYLGYQLVRDWDTLGPIFATARYGLLGLSVVVLVFAYAVVAGRWYVVLRDLDVKIGWWESLRVWFLSQAGRYLPGSIWPYIGRFYWGGQNIPADKMATSIGLELVFRVSSESVLAAVLLLVAVLIANQQRTPLVEALGFAAAVLFGHVILLSAGPLVFRRIVHGLGNRASRLAFVTQVTISRSRLVWIWAYYAASVIAVGIAFYLFVSAFYRVGLSALPGVIGALAAATVVGFLVPLAPNGWGVREGILVLLLSAYMPTPVAVMISVTSRAWLAVIEGLWGLSLVAVTRVFSSRIPASGRDEAGPQTAALSRGNRNDTDGN